MAMVGWVGAGMEVVVSMHAVQCQSISGYAGALPESAMWRPWSRLLPGTQLWLAGIPVKALLWDATRRLRFVVHAAGWLHSMVLHGRSGDVGN